MPFEMPSREVVEAANEKSRRLKALLQAPEIVIMPGAFNVLSALLFQHLGFEAIQGSSAGFANATGHPDLGISRPRTVELTRLCAQAVRVPVNADGEDGYGGPDDVRETVRGFIDAGAAGMNMEDSDRHSPGKLLDIKFQVEKIAAFMDERKTLGSEFLLNARCDAFIALANDRPAALKEAVKRGQAWAEAGADSVFFFRVAEPDFIKTLVKEIPAPVSILAGPGIPSARELEEWGVARVSYGSAFLQVAVAAVRNAAIEVRDHKTHELMADGVRGQEMQDILRGRVS
jgi:2-methylisocitrate lyase-like PEP mutase family enzyme